MTSLVNEMTSRFALTLPGRILIDSEAEQTCTLTAIQDRVAHFRTHGAGVDGRHSTAIAYLDIVGRIKGSTVRVGHDRVVLTVEATDAKWARLRQQFSRLANMSDAEREDLRSHRRIVPDQGAVAVTLLHGIIVAGRIRDLSRSGAAVEVLAAVEVGDRVTLGATRGQVIRLFNGGFAMQFVRLLPFERFDTSFQP